MTYEALEKDLNEIIEDTRNQIEAEEKTAKSANYPLLKERLAQAIKIKEDISEAEKYGMNGDSFKYEIMQLKEPIYYAPLTARRLLMIFSDISLFCARRVLAIFSPPAIYPDSQICLIKSLFFSSRCSNSSITINPLKSLKFAF